MKRQIFLYLFLFTLLLVIFQYMNEKSIFENQENKIDNLRAKLEVAEDSISDLNDKVGELNYFTLQGNENAMSYLESFGYDSNDIEKLVTNQIYDQNLLKGNNPLVPFDGMNGEMKINKLKFLNHKWILADFTDGTYWGEMILEYSIGEDKVLTLNTIASTIYPQ
ncbi:hydrolase [Aequorivita sp. H23M31]|uniref:Hydrolase n=1 Tax=Aequorivita ciconiae TaxID=2494375 RepID=A0A410G102_9FLAO|nr:hydrolase [Aequorivita sp. H23M31]QAA80958.1 hydrolase [Aequorivita sp. H23M31]